MQSSSSSQVSSHLQKVHVASVVGVYRLSRFAILQSYVDRISSAFSALVLQILTTLLPTKLNISRCLYLRRLFDKSYMTSNHEKTPKTSGFPFTFPFSPEIELQINSQRVSMQMLITPAILLYSILAKLPWCRSRGGGASILKTASRDFTTELV